jgi:hypothetical protein
MSLHLFLHGLKWIAYLMAAMLVVLFAAWILVPDESLDPDIALLIARPAAAPVDDNGYFAWWGMRASPELDPHAVGQKIVIMHEQRVAAGATLNAFIVDDYLGATPLPLPADTGRCTTDQKNCLLFYRGLADRIAADTETFMHALARYRKLRGYTQFSERVMSPTLESPQPDYSMLTAMSYLVDGGIARDVAAPASRKSALLELASEIRMWRNTLAHSDTLPTQMVAVAVLHRKYRLASEIMAVYPDTAHVYASLLRDITQPLPLQQISLTRPLASEFRLGARVWQTLEQMPFNSEAAPQASDRVRAAVMRMSYRRNATVNRMHAMYRRNLVFLTLPPAEMRARQKEYQALQADIDPWRPDVLLYNPLGKILIGVGSVDYSDYAFRIYDLVGLSRLLEIQRRIADAGVRHEHVPEFLLQLDAGLANPYTARAMNFDAASGMLSFAGYGKRQLKTGPIQISLRQ